MLLLISPKSLLLYLFLIPGRLLGSWAFKSLISAPTLLGVFLRLDCRSPDRNEELIPSPMDRHAPLPLA